jgi:hypothetical protein
MRRGVIYQLTLGIGAIFTGGFVVRHMHVFGI